jgi:gluconolactonase
MALLDLDVRDDRFPGLFEPDAALAIVASGFKFLEGPAWHPDEHHLTFSDITGNSIYRWSARDGLRDIRPNSYLANGNTYDRQGRLLTCHHATSCVTRLEADGSITVIADRYQGKALNSPNDIVVTRDGTIWFTDPLSGREPRYGIPRAPELPFRGVYRVQPEDGTVVLLIDDFDKPNGLCFSLDERSLFINDTARRHIRVFHVQPDGTLTNGRVWAETRGDGPGVPDGMKIDRAGMLWCCGPGGIHVFAPDAACWGVVRFNEQVANFAWGDADLRSLYVTASSTLYRLRVRVPGLPLFESSR